jgi:sugar lactone lactonase YvrE
MNSLLRILALLVIILVLVAFAFSGQKVETVNGVRLVHNSGPGLWGKTSKVALEPVGVLGDVEATDQNLAFYIPMNIALDAAGNLYVLDSGNHRVQKFGPDGKHLATFGRQGQGPGEFVYPSWLSVDAKGFLYVSDPNNNRVQVLTPDGKDHKTLKLDEGMVGDVFPTKDGGLLMGQPRLRFRFGGGEEDKSAPLPKLVKVLDAEGKLLREFGEPRDFGEELANTAGNEMIMTIDASGQAYLVFAVQNRIEKYAADGKLLWRADRELPYSMEVTEKGKVDRSGGNISVRAPRMNRCAGGVAVDAKGRVWVVTLTRQLKQEERVGISIAMTGSVGGGRSIGQKVQGDTELRTTDAYKLEVFDADGALLGSIPLDFFVDGIFIFGDRLFLMDRYRGTQFKEYRIKG